MRTKTPEYYEYLHNRTPDQAITDAKATIEQILNAVNCGELAIHPFYHSILRHGKGFITDYQIEAGQQVDHVWPIQLVRKKLAIIQWWHKVLVRIDNTICPIQAVYETCTTCPATLARLLSIPRDHINNPATNSEGDPCPICGQCEYRPEDGACVNCGDTTNAEKYVMRRDNGEFKTFHGKICKRCGTTERFIGGFHRQITNKCVYCFNKAKKEREEKSYERQKERALKRPYVIEAMKRNGLKTYEEFQEWSRAKHEEHERIKAEYKNRTRTPLYYEGEPCEYCQKTRKSAVTHECVKCSLMPAVKKARMIASKLEPIDLETFFYGKPCLTCGSTIRYKSGSHLCRDCVKRKSKKYRSANGKQKKAKPDNSLEKQAIKEQLRIEKERVKENKRLERERARIEREKLRNDGSKVKTYEGKPCVSCGSTIRYKSHGICVNCHKRRMTIINLKNKSKAL
ncbi:hypothetical protein OCZ42_004604 [Salmonella enterica]|nr:hypothetical protein [Salmonella enterica]